MREKTYHLCRRNMLFKCMKELKEIKLIEIIKYGHGWL